MKSFTTRVYIMETGILNDDNLFMRLYGTVSRNRQNKIDRYRFRRDKNLSLAAGLLLNKAFSELGIGGMQISYGDNGKPYVSDGSIFFNLSHSGERAMCAISPTEVGCDTERIKDVNFEIADRFFTRSECDILNRRTDIDEKIAAFFRLWTLKESFMKVTGYGMKLALDSFSIDLGNEITVTQSVSPDRYHFREYNRHDGYRYAVCTTTPEFEDSMRLVMPYECICG